MPHPSLNATVVIRLFFSHVTHTKPTFLDMISHQKAIEVAGLFKITPQIREGFDTKYIYLSLRGTDGELIKKFYISIHRDSELIPHVFVESDVNHEVKIDLAEYRDIKIKSSMASIYNPYVVELHI